MSSPETAPRHKGPRPLSISNETIEYGNIEAWINIIESYRQRHPSHQVTILYREEPVASLISLYKQVDELSREDFQVAVSAPDRNYKDEPKLYRLLVEGAGPDYQRFISKEIHQVLKLF